jgi:hypothetical protein
MPLTEFQSGVLRVIAGNRSVASHVAGGIVLNADADQGIEPGVVFLAPDGSVRWFDTPGYAIHRATLGGVIPRLGGVHYEL